MRSAASAGVCRCISQTSPVPGSTSAMRSPSGDTNRSAFSTIPTLRIEAEAQTTARHLSLQGWLPRDTFAVPRRPTKSYKILTSCYMGAKG